MLPVLQGRCLLVDDACTVAYHKPQFRLVGSLYRPGDLEISRMHAMIGP